jgi:hypothetical protein
VLAGRGGGATPAGRRSGAKKWEARGKEAVARRETRGRRRVARERQGPVEIRGDQRGGTRAMEALGEDGSGLAARSGGTARLGAPDGGDYGKYPVARRISAMGTGKERLGIEIGGWRAPGKSSAWCRGSGSRARCRGAREGVGPASSKEVCNAASSSSAEEDRGVAAVKGGDERRGDSVRLRSREL